MLKQSCFYLHGPSVFLLFSRNFKTILFLFAWSASSALCGIQRHQWSACWKGRKNLREQIYHFEESKVAAVIIPCITKVSQKKVLQKKCLFSCPGQLNRWPCHSVSQWRFDWETFERFWETFERLLRDFWETFERLLRGLW